LLAAVALAVGTTIIINLGRAKYAWVTMAPLAFLTTTTLTAGFLSVKNSFWPMAVNPAKPELHLQGMLQSILTVTMMICVVVILTAAIRKWVLVGNTGSDPDLVGETA
jgi:carbon starvation protein